MSVQATGGIESTVEIGGITYKLHVFNASGTLSVSAGGDADYLIVGGGGSGGGAGSSVSGGGGAGGLINGTATLSTGDHAITVGTGGASVSGSGNAGNNGGDSSAFANIAVGGGGGGRYTDSAGDGGSGGGAGADAALTSTAGSGLAGQGHDGGAAAAGGSQADAASAGGGGAASAGGDGTSGVSSGSGGAGVDLSGVYGTSVGDNGWFAGGGGGAGHNATAGAGGQGGGGAGGQDAGGTDGTDGTGGGGGGGCSNGSSGAGGDGVVIVRYPLDGGDSGDDGGDDGGDGDDPCINCPPGEKGDKGDPGPAPQMRTNDDMVEWKHEDQTTWNPLFQIPQGGGGGSTQNPVFLSSAEYGIFPSGNGPTDQANLQAFFDHVAASNVTGVLEDGVWRAVNTLELPDGIRLMGRGMTRTVIEAKPEDWEGGSQYRVLRMYSGGGINTNGLYLADLQVIGADKNRVDDGPLIRVEGVENFLIERVMAVDASSYGIYVTGYGEGSFTNDILSSFWNSTFRGTVRDCLAIRGQIGFGTEGGAENVLFQRCVAIGNYGVGSMDWGLHGYRSASGYNVWYDRCRATGYRNGFLLDRYRNMMVAGAHIFRCRTGVAVGSFYSSDPEISHDLRIVNNYFHCVEENGTGPSAITDSYLSSRRVQGVVIQGNVCSQGGISLRQCRQVIVTGNTALQGGDVIRTASGATGLVANNAMGLSNSASGIVDGGNNIFFPGY